ncbi:kelch domain-containing protein 2-like [Corticium candelabrum]|uniref:kelch domain-containing protein 2-like n=1 Tax=Corticium candelabrum TaxID=121492 RepID=UPI002E27749B|nr:kelch domain-containing protein 2-like [Corticium candelabrum]
MSYSLSSESRYSETKCRMAHACVMRGSNIIMLGGDTESEFTWPGKHSRMELYIYNTESDKWQLLETGGCIDESIWSGGCAAAVDETLYVLCGFDSDNSERSNSVYSLDFHTMKWQHVVPTFDSEIPSRRDKFCVWTNEKRIYIFGGFGPPGKMKSKFVLLDGFSGWNNSIHVFDTESSRWSELIAQGSSPCPRAAHAGATYGKRGYVFGGRFQNTRMNDIHYLDLETETWSGCIETVGIKPEGRSWHSLACAGSSFLFLYGGFNTENHILDDAWLFNIVTCEWIQVLARPPCIATRMWHTACSSGRGEVYVFGGSSASIFGSKETLQHGRHMLIFKCDASSLLRLCIDFIVQRPFLFHQFFPALPVGLRRQIEAQLESL